MSTKTHLSKKVLSTVLVLLITALLSVGYVDALPPDLSAIGLTDYDRGGRYV
jgi:hypothetical protein